MSKRAATKEKASKKTKKSKFDEESSDYADEGEEDFNDQSLTVSDDKELDDQEFVVEDSFEDELIEVEETPRTKPRSATKRTTATSNSNNNNNNNNNNATRSSSSLPKTTGPTLLASAPLTPTTPRAKSTQPVPRTRTPNTSDVRARMMALPQATLVSAICGLINNGEVSEQSLLNVLPEPTCQHHVDSLQKAANAIGRALPHSRFCHFVGLPILTSSFGSPSDHYGFKRCSSAVQAFKQVWKNNFTAVTEYAAKAVDILEDAVDFDEAKDNAYKTQCLKQINPTINKLEKDKSLNETQKGHLVTVTKALEKVRAEAAEAKQRKQKK